MDTPRLAPPGGRSRSSRRRGHPARPDGEASTIGTITLLRHGQASFGAADYDALSDLGRAQAALAGRVLATRGLRDPVWACGTLRRQRDTATIAMAAHAGDDVAGPDAGPGAGPGAGGADLRVDEGWDEYDHVGMVRRHAAAAGGATPEDPTDFQRILDVALRGWVEADDPDGWRAFAEGARRALVDLAASLPSGRDAVVATSGGVIAAICAGLLGGGADAVVALNRVTVNAGLTTLLSGRSGLSLLTFNDHAHLLGDAADLRTYR